MNALRKSLINYKYSMLLDIGVMGEKVDNFDESIYRELKKYYFNGLPLSIRIKYQILDSECGFDTQSKFLLFAFDDAELVYGELDSYKAKNGDDGVHFWVENNGMVYDSNGLYVVEKEWFDKMHGVHELGRVRKSELIDDEIIREINMNRRKAYLPDGCRREVFLNNIQPVKNLAFFNENLMKDLAEFFGDIRYQDFENRRKSSNARKRA